MAVKNLLSDKFVLIEWVGENLFSVLPMCFAKDPHQCRVGACMDFKWANPNSRSKKSHKYFKALVLKISSKYIFLDNCQRQLVRHSSILSMPAVYDC